MWDNSLTKTNPKAPDYQCKDSTCIDGESGYRTAVWAPNGKRAIIIDKLMGVCVDAAKAILAERFKTGSEIPPELVVNLATTMYISRTRDAAGIMSIEKDSLAAAARKAAEEAERKRIEAEAAAARRTQDETGWDQDPGQDDDLPF
jgi:hypothetical protein